MSASFHLDTRQFNKAIVDYKFACGRDWADIINKKALQLAFEAMKETGKADKEAIRKLQELPWWPKYIAKRISKTGASYTRRIKGKTETFNVKGRYTRAEARAISRRIIMARVRSTAFHKSGWLPAIKRLFPLVKDRAGLRSGQSGVKIVGVEKGSGIAAMPGASPWAMIKNSAEGITKMGKGALQRALNYVTADTMVYIARKMQERANKMR